MKRTPLAIGVVAVAVAGLVCLASPANASTAAHASAPAPRIIPALPLPPHVDAPYVDVTAVPDLAAASAESGSKDLTLAFLQTPSAGSCTVDWAGNPAAPVAASTFGQAIDTIRERGGDVIPSFGGYSADTTGTEIADSCTDVHKIALAYENVVTTYRAQRIDFDVEADSLTNTAGIQRRNEAIRELETWAAHTGRRLSISYTLPSTPQGLGATGLDVLNSAAAEHATIGVVNAMTFDYYDGLPHDMATDAETAATGLVSQLRQTISPLSSDAALWRQVGITEMIGVDDYGPSETLTVAGAQSFVAWASAHHLASVSFWALERDNGSCVGTTGANLCSGIAQTPWQFSHAFARFTSYWY